LAEALNTCEQPERDRHNATQPHGSEKERIEMRVAVAMGVVHDSVAPAQRVRRTTHD